ncbi:MAG: PIN domain-containing protein [Bacteroidetes bacterium]|nr:PIN domain-containing protein [Bacteroidota bacterium]
MMRVLVDSDVVISAFLSYEVQSADSQKLMDALDAGEFIGVTTPVLMANIQYVLGRKWGEKKRGEWMPDRAKVVRAMQRILPMFSEMIPVTMADFHASMASKFEDLEDGLQHFAAIRARGIDAIVSSNGKDYRHTAIKHYTPADFLNDCL